MYIEQNAIDYLNSKFNLPAKGDEQDWDIELADPNRLEEFIDYLFIKTESQSVKLALMALILASYDDYLNYNKANIKIWNKIEACILKDIRLYTDLLRYWGLYNEKNTQEKFNITAQVRCTFNMLYGTSG